MKNQKRMTTPVNSPAYLLYLDYRGGQETLPYLHEVIAVLERIGIETIVYGEHEVHFIPAARSEIVRQLIDAWSKELGYRVTFTFQRVQQSELPVAA